MEIIIMEKEIKKGRCGVKIKIICLIILGLVTLGLFGCHTTEERLTNVGESIHNIVLDGDGVN